MVKIHKSSFIAPTAVIIGDVTIGENCGVFPHAVIRGDENSIMIGDDPTFKIAASSTQMQSIQ